MSPRGYVLPEHDAKNYSKTDSPESRAFFNLIKSNMIYKTEINDHSFIEAEGCSVDKYVLLHIVQTFTSHDGILVESVINLQLDDRMCIDLIKSLRYSLDDLNS